MKKKLKLVGISAITLLSLSAFISVQRLMDRPGERALSLIPATSKGFAVIDFSPTASQLLTFKKIDDAMGPTGWSDMVKSVLDLSGMDPKMSSVFQQHVGRGAVIALPSGLDKVEPAALISVDNIGSFQSDLEKLTGPKFFKGLKYYRVSKDSPMILGVVGNYIGIASEPAGLLPFKRVEWGFDKGITTDESVRSALAMRPDATNVSVMFAPSPEDKEWYSVNIGMENEGLTLAFRGKVDPKNEFVGKIGKIAGFDATAAKRLPSGAYMQMAVSQIGQFADAMGMSLEDAEMKSGLDGRSIVALYPTDKKKVEGIDLLAIMDDYGTANPAKMMETQAVNLGEMLTEENKDREPFVVTEYRGVKITDLNPAIVEELREAMKTSIQESKAEPEKDADSPINALDFDMFLDEKTLVLGQFGRTAMVSTNLSLLKRSIDTYLDGSGSGNWVLGNQMGIRVDFAQLLKGIRGFIKMEKLKADQRKQFEDAMKQAEAYATESQLGAFMRPTGNFAVTGSWPIDYSEAFKIPQKK